MILKPFQFASYKGPYGNSICQIISYPTPDGTIIIRTVPGHSGTLKEVNLKDLSHAEQHYRWVHYARVEGSGSFPVDMLRYDCAVPLNFDLEAIDPKFGFDSRIIAAVSKFEERTPFTVDRWRSFLWSITTIKVARL